MKCLSNLKNSFSLSRIEIFSLFSNFDSRFTIICEYVYDTTSFIIRKRTNKSKNKIKFSNFIWKVMSIINKTIESNDSTSLNTFTTTISTACWSKSLFRWCSIQKWNLKMLFKKISKSMFLQFEIASYSCRKWDESARRVESKL
jgi:hypothetical protein